MSWMKPALVGTMEPRSVWPRPPIVQLPEHVVLHERQDFAVVLVLVVMSVHVDDQDVVELALDRLLAGVSEKPGGVQLVDRYASAAFSEEVHVRLLTFPK